VFYLFEGTYNSSELQLLWESHRPVTVNSELLLTEYRLIDTRTTSTEDTAPLLMAAEPTHPRLRPNDTAGQSPRSTCLYTCYNALEKNIVSSTFDNYRKIAFYYISNLTNYNDYK